MTMHSWVNKIPVSAPESPQFKQRFVIVAEATTLFLKYYYKLADATTLFLRKVAGRARHDNKLLGE